jgi:hypothetical protein
MTLQKFISRLNWRQIVIHFIASFFFIYAFMTLAYLYDSKLLDRIRLSNQVDKIQGIETVKYSTVDFINFLRIPLYSAIVGLWIAFIISLVISIRRKWFWFNSLITFLLTYFLYRFDLIGWRYLKNIFLALGQLFNDTFIELLLNGTLMLTIGLFLFFLRPILRFIDNGNKLRDHYSQH